MYVNKIDADKLKAVPDDLKKHNDVSDKMLKRIVHDQLVTTVSTRDDKIRSGTELIDYRFSQKD